MVQVAAEVTRHVALGGAGLAAPVSALADLAAGDAATLVMKPGVELVTTEVRAGDVHVATAPGTRVPVRA